MGPYCSDGTVNGNEQCDDGNLINGDGCTSNCAAEYCGDGIINRNELCDQGSGNGDICIPGYASTCEYCDTDCNIQTNQGGYCGDTLVNGNEQCEQDTDCDDQNAATNDLCSGCLCSNDNPIVCGDGNIDEGEACDDGNLINGDGCTANCVTEYCGDGIINRNEQCDSGTQNGLVCNPGYASSCTYCNANCETTVVEGPYCGDTLINGNEECELNIDCNDQNQFTDDYCTGCECSHIDELVCGDGNIDEGEACDDANTVDNDGCNAVCQREFCGDNIIK